MIEYIVLIGVFLVVVFPAVFFNGVEKHLFQESSEPVYLNAYHKIQMDTPDTKMKTEAASLEKFESLVQNAPNLEMRRIWENKRQQYLNSIRWQRLVEHSSGKSTLYGKAS